MAGYDASFVFTVTNTFTAGTTILSSEVNQNFTDVKSGLDDITNGTAKFAIVQAQSGATNSAANPAFRPLEDSNNSGFYRAAANQIGLSINGTGQLVFSDGAIMPVTDNDIDLGSGSFEFKDAYIDGTIFSNLLHMADGSAASPSITFKDDTDTGIYSPGANQIGLAVGGTSIFSASSSAIALNASTTITGIITATGNTSAFGRDIDMGIAQATGDGATARISGVGDKFRIAPTNGAGSFNFNKELFYDHSGDQAWTVEGNFIVGNDLDVTGDAEISNHVEARAFGTKLLTISNEGTGFVTLISPCSFVFITVADEDVVSADKAKWYYAGFCVGFNNSGSRVLLDDIKRGTATVTQAGGGSPTGTTYASAGEIAVQIQSNGNLFIENRAGAEYKFSVTVLSPSLASEI